MTKRIKLTEVDRNVLFKNGELVKLGNYSISPDLIYGIHIPTHNRTEGELIMKQILDNHEIVERLKDWIYSKTPTMHPNGWLPEEVDEMLKEILGESND